MTEIFITDIQTKTQAERVLSVIRKDNPELKINFDLKEIDLPFPCGHTILRAEGQVVNSQKILTGVKTIGFNCEILEDKVCI